jgi:hypothetical protein
MESHAQPHSATGRALTTTHHTVHDFPPPRFELVGIIDPHQEIVNPFFVFLLYRLRPIPWQDFAR